MDYEGYRVHRYTDGSVFSGVWEGGRKKGLGVMQLADGAVYEGEFSSACAVVPPWVNKAAAAGDLFSGLGRIFHQNGSGYIGQFDRGVRHGFGEYTDVVRGEVFTGEWSDDRRGSNSHLDRAVPRGAGTHAWDDKSRYQGEWEDGLQHGNGTYRYANGDKYIGEWRKGWQHGFGIMQPKADGKSKKLLYEWQNGEPVAVFEDDRDAAKQYNATSSAALIASGQAKTLQWASRYLLKRAELLADSAVEMVNSSRGSPSSLGSSSPEQEQEESCSSDEQEEAPAYAESFATRLETQMSPREALQPIAECGSWRDFSPNTGGRPAPVPSPQSVHDPLLKPKEKPKQKRRSMRSSMFESLRSALSSSLGADHRPLVQPTSTRIHTARSPRRAVGELSLDT